uniref:Uncharacterized protein n=1 Tax=Taeniopygia guttata TaxID=59729 RepID=A0A674GKV7_TAEGU
MPLLRDPLPEPSVQELNLTVCKLQTKEVIIFKDYILKKNKLKYKIYINITVCSIFTEHEKHISELKVLHVF